MTFSFSKRAGIAAVCVFNLSMVAQVAPAPDVQKTSSDLPKLTYDVATIRESQPGPNGFFVSSKSPLHEARYEGTNVGVNWLVVQAYGLRNDQLVGGPDWIRRSMFMVLARSDEAVTETLKKLSDEQADLVKKSMLQDLLTTRFHLAVHTETREMVVYTLTIDKGGLKMQPSKIASTGDEKADAEKNKRHTTGYCNESGCETSVKNWPMPEIVGLLKAHMGADIIDKTGLVDKYDFKLQFKGREPGNQPDNGTTDFPPLTTALKETLGLKLERGKGPVQVVVIDHVEKPTEN